MLYLRYCAASCVFSVRHANTYLHGACNKTLLCLSVSAAARWAFCAGVLGMLLVAVLLGTGGAVKLLSPPIGRTRRWVSLWWTVRGRRAVNGASVVGGTLRRCAYWRDGKRRRWAGRLGGWAARTVWIDLPACHHTPATRCIPIPCITCRTPPLPRLHPFTLFLYISLLPTVAPSCPPLRTCGLCARSACAHAAQNARVYLVSIRLCSDPQHPAGRAVRLLKRRCGDVVP